MEQSQKIRGVNQMMTLRGGNFGQDHRGSFAVGAVLVPLVLEMATRSHHSVDGLLKFEGASSNPVPEGQRAFALAAVRHQKSSPLISAQEKTHTDVKGQENPGHTSGDRLHFPVSSGNPDVTKPGALDLEGHYWVPK